MGTARAICWREEWMTKPRIFLGSSGGAATRQGIRVTLSAPEYNKHDTGARMAELPTDGGAA